MPVNPNNTPAPVQVQQSNNNMRSSYGAQPMYTRYMDVSTVLQKVSVRPAHGGAWINSSPPVSRCRYHATSTSDVRGPVSVLAAETILIPHALGPCHAIEAPCCAIQWRPHVKVWGAKLKTLTRALGRIRRSGPQPARPFQALSRTRREQLNFPLHVHAKRGQDSLRGVCQLFLAMCL